jgi:hypothetical protein
MTLLHILQGFQKGSEHFQKICMYKESECRQMMHATIKKNTSGSFLSYHPPFLYSRTCTPKYASAEHLDSLSRTDGLPHDEADLTPCDFFLWGEQGLSVCATFAKRHRHTETTHFGGSCVSCSGHAWKRVASDGLQNLCFPSDKRDRHCVCISNTQIITVPLPKYISL